jgi:hypothetical protein
MMGMLVAISLGLSSLVLRELEITKITLDKGKAYFAAEAGLERTLLALKENLPGWQGDLSGNFEQANSNYQVELKNRCKTFPCFDPEEFDVNSAPERALYYQLDLNESVNIPLFVVEGGEVFNVEDFNVQFWSPLNKASDFNFESDFDISSWDVLRWKVYGVDKFNNFPETISDFTAVSLLGLGEDGGEFEGSTDAQNPSWFGTVSCSNQNDRVTDRINCNPYVDLVDNAALEAEFDYVEGQADAIFSGICDHTEAREFYSYGSVNGSRKLETEDIRYCYPIKQFLSEHTLNYLSLTNLVNPNVFSPRLELEEKQAKQKLYVRVELFGGQTSRQTSVIKSVGRAGDVVNALEMQVRDGQLMPVFNLSLYDTGE